MIVATLILLQFQGLYGILSTVFTAIKQSCTCTCTCTCESLRRPNRSPDDDPTYRYNPGDDVVIEVDPMSNHNYDYSEIDMGKTQTLQPSNSQQIPRLRYEECVIDQRNSHPYSDWSNNSPETTDDDDPTPDVHNYAILEPGSNKRLHVRVLTEDYFEDDPSRVYFKLEPGTNKVTPQFQVKFEDIRKDHTYFVLEPSDEIVEDENAYAVESLMEHNYFILEKTYSNM